jgi:hypothetical protein
VSSAGRSRRCTSTDSDVPSRGNFPNHRTNVQLVVNPLPWPSPR